MTPCMRKKKRIKMMLKLKNKPKNKRNKKWKTKVNNQQTIKNETKKLVILCLPSKVYFDELYYINLSFYYSQDHSDLINEPKIIQLYK